MKRVFLTLCFAALLLAGTFGFGWLFDFSRPDAILGLTFSDFYVEHELGLDPHEAYLAILNELKPHKLRLVAYWNRIEKERGQFDTTALDSQIVEAETRGIPVVLALGYRTPRWPECHIPDWAAELPPDEFKQALFSYFDAIIGRYRESKTVTVWQVENEPLLGVFGRCPAPNRKFLKEEIAYVKEKDPSRPILTTASGELSFWTRTAGLTDIFGTTLYRHIWNKHVGNFTHVYPPAWYALRAWFAKTFLGMKDIVIAELQAEPWGEGKPLAEMPLESQTKAFTAQHLENIVKFAKRTGIREIYLWGPEWWYYRKLNGDPSFWEAGKRIFGAE
jgi:hypothetical protein